MNDCICRTCMDHESENARLRALLDERTALLRECEEERLPHLAAIGVNGLKSQDKLTRRIRAALETK